MSGFKYSLILSSTLLTLGLAMAENNAMLNELERDKISLSAPPNQLLLNPLKLIRPATYKETALDYVFHSFSELAEDGVTYPTYNWELGQAKYELAKYKLKGNLAEFAGMAQLSEEEKNLLLQKAKEGLISGALSKKGLSCESRQKYLLIGKKSIYTVDQLSLIQEKPIQKTPIIEKLPVTEKLPEPTPNTAEVTAGNEPFAIPAPGKKGIVYYPLPGGKYDPTQPIDVVDMKPGERMRCPYTGRIFRVP